MGKLETIEKKQTSWGGLWWHPEINSFSSQALSLAQLRKFKGNVRLYVRKNRFYNDGVNNRPNYTFQFRDANSENPTELAVDDMEETAADKIQLLADLMYEGAHNADRGEWPSRSQERMLALQRAALDIIEELTGQPWLFTCTTL